MQRFISINIEKKLNSHHLIVRNKSTLFKYLKFLINLDI